MPINSLNGILFKSSETVIISLLKSCCVPVLLYALEALDLNPTVLRRLDNSYSWPFVKYSRLSIVTTIMNCMYFTNTSSLRFQLLNRKVNFLTKLEAYENKLLAKLLSILGLKELEAVHTDLIYFNLINIILYTQLLTKFYKNYKFDQRQYEWNVKGYKGQVLTDTLICSYKN